MEIAKDLIIPICPDSVLSPEIMYGDKLTALYFMTEDDKYGRVTFEKLDSLKVSRGEYFPYNYVSKSEAPFCWVKTIENSSWLRERYEYELEHYGTSYEFGGDVSEMLHDFKHYVFSFHDEFIEAIAMGLWVEEDSESMFGKDLSEGHPFRPITNDIITVMEAHGLRCQVRINNKSEEDLKRHSTYCSQKLMEFSLELESTTVSHTLYLVLRNNRYISQLKKCFGKTGIEFDKLAGLEDVKPYLEEYMKEVAARRKQLGKA